MRPKKTDDKYWTGTRNFNHIQYESDLDDYIIDLENETQQLRKNAVVGQSEQLVCRMCGTNEEMSKDYDLCYVCWKEYHPDAN